MKTIHKIILIAWLFLGALTSCTSRGPVTDARPTKAFETAAASQWTHVAETQIAMPTGTPTMAPTEIYLPGPFYTVMPPRADEQTYVDPEGWYSINIPADMKSYDQPNIYYGHDSYFESGFLPYMSRHINLCLWLANVMSNPVQSAINWMEPCTVSAGYETGFTMAYRIYENPLADPEHRFVYIKMGHTNPRIGGVKYTISWLKTASSVISASTPLNSEEVSFWRNPATTLKGTTLKEYNLPPEAQVGPTQDMLLGFLPEEAKPAWDSLPPSQKTPTPAEQLKSLGYELKIETEPVYQQRLFRDGRPLFDDVTRVSKVYRFTTASGPVMAFTVNTQLTNSFLILNDTIHPWDDLSGDPDFAPVLYKGELLWAKQIPNAGVEVRRSDRKALFTFRTYFATHLEVDSFRAWGDHWTLAAGDFLVQDGEILNQKLGFQEIFEFSLVDGKPVYMFRRGTRMGLSYNGRFLLLPYEDIPRGMCCGYASNNPMTINDSIHFFGKRDGVWYYAIVKFR